MHLWSKRRSFTQKTNALHFFREACWRESFGMDFVRFWFALPIGASLSGRKDLAESQCFRLSRICEGEDFFFFSKFVKQELSPLKEPEFSPRSARFSA